jgi:hypothetical protein
MSVIQEIAMGVLVLAVVVLGGISIFKSDIIDAQRGYAIERGCASYDTKTGRWSQVK